MLVGGQFSRIFMMHVSCCVFTGDHLSRACSQHGTIVLHFRRWGKDADRLAHGVELCIFTVVFVVNLPTYVFISLLFASIQHACYS